ncbi:MAG: substrate-binding domain-containing protein [Bacteroidota bacterium]|nr:substrate-binding domain-containing protein [Ferruginibacter sp.]
MLKRVSLKDIASQVGVSSALVSYVLNGKNTGRINKLVAQKIRDTARELNYRTNQIARSLKTNRTNTLGFIVANISNPFSSHLARIIEDEAAKSNYTVLFGSSDENAHKFRNLIETFVNRQVDGLILAPGEDTADQIVYLKEQQVPFVMIDRYYPDLDTNYVALDNFNATYEAINHLLACGYRRIGMVNYDTTIFNLNERTRGYLAALKNEANIDGTETLRVVMNRNIRSDVNKVMDELLALEEPVDALLFASNEIALYGVIHLNEIKIKVPEELAVITFDELISWDLFYAPLTYVKQPLQQMGEIATRFLIDSMEDINSVQQLVLPGSLIIRESTRSKA